MVSTRAVASGTNCRTFATARSSAGAEMSAIMTRAPSLAKRIDVSRPIPLWGDIMVSSYVNASTFRELATSEKSWVWDPTQSSVRSSVDGCGMLVID